MSGFPSLRSLFVSLLFFSSTISSLAISGTGLSYANGVLQNQYFRMETGNNWNGIDPVLTDTDILTSASFIHDDFTGSMTVIPLYDTYMSDFIYLDYMLENAESIAEVAGTVVAKEYFLTNQGHQAFAIHYETNLLGNTLSFYSFGIDGTTTGYQGTPGNWLYFPILISNSTLSFQQALDIAKTVEFTEGSPAPAKSMTEFNGLSPGGSSPIAYTPPLGGNDLGMGWYESESFGIYYDSKNGWVYSINLGWLYIKKLLSGYWCWSQKNDWLWTSVDVYPHCYSNITDDWIYFDFSNKDNTQVYNFSSYSWTSWDDSNLIEQAQTSLTEHESNAEEQELRNIYHSNSLSDEEKINKIAEIIFWGL